MKTVFSKDSVIKLGDLSWDEVQDLRHWLTNYSDTTQPLFQDKLKQDKIDMDKARLKNEKAKQIKAERQPKIDAWLRKNATVGMKFKMKGCRDGQGIRTFLTFSKNDSASNWLILECRQIQTVRYWDGHRTETETKLGQITQHMSDKVVSVFLNNEWIPMYKLIQ